MSFGRIVVPNGSSGTHAGLAAGLKAMGDEPSRVMSFTVLAPLAKALEAIRDLASATLTLLDPAKEIADGDIVMSVANWAMATAFQLARCSRR